MKGIPESALPLAWANFKEFEMNPNTALPPKVKELIGLGVASQIPCHYCVLFHTEAAKLNGASDEEVREAIYQASVTRQLSTIVNGVQTDYENFERETQQIISYVKKQAGQSAREPMTARR